MKFDIQGARAAGYPDAEIADYLGKAAGFDVAGARDAGYSDAEIIGRLAGPAPASQPGPITRAVAAVKDAVNAIKAGSDAHWGGAEPSEEELAQASQPARMTMTRGGQRVLQPNEPVQSAPNAELSEPSASWSDVVQSVPGQFVAGTRSAAANLRRMAAEESVAQRESALKPADVDPAGWGGVMPAGAKARQQQLLEKDRQALAAAVADAAQADTDTRLVTPQGRMTVAQEALSSLAQSAGPTMLGLAAGILSRNVPLAIAIAGGGGSAQQAGATYGEARQHGAGHRQASLAATIDGALEAGGEALPIGFALKPGTPVFRRLFGTIAREAGQEAATQFAQDVRALSMERPDLTFGEMWRNVKVAALAGAGGGAVYGGIGAAANAGRSTDGRDDGGKQKGTDEAISAGIQDLATDPEAMRKPAGSELSQLRGPGDSGLRGVEGELSPVPERHGAEAESGTDPGKGGQQRSVPSGQLQMGDTRGTSPKSPVLPEANAGQQGNDDPGDVEVTGNPGGDAAISDREFESSDRAGGTQGADTAHTAGSVDAAAHEAATSATNELSEPSQGQIEANNYKKSHVKVAGLDISIENPEGSTRSGVDAGGKAWSVPMSAHYGYIRETNGKDGEHVDVYVAPGTRGDYAGPVFVVDQRDPVTNRFDEHKVVLGVRSAAEAQGVYDAHFSDGSGPHRRVMVTKTTVPELKQWLGAGRRLKPFAGPLYEARSARLGRESEETLAAGIGKPIVMSPGYVAREESVPASAQARPDAIRQSIRDLLKVPINEGGVTMRKALGIYKVKPRTIRVRNQNDISVIAHEVGHHISETSQTVRTLMSAHEAELSTITPYAAGQRTIPRKLEEGFAEFVRFYLSSPAQAKAKAPGFYAGFKNYIGRTGKLRPILSQIQGSIADWMNLSPADRIMAKVGTPPKSPLQRLQYHFTKDRFIFEVLDNWNPVRRMRDDLNPNVDASLDPFKAAHLLAGDGAIIESWLTEGTIPFKPNDRANPENYGKPLSQILKPVSGHLKEFGAYLIAKRGLELMKAGKENLFTREELMEMTSARRPEFVAAAKEVYAYNDRLLKYAVDGGLLSDQVAEKFRQIPFYVPFYREGDANGARRRGEVFKQLRGGTQNIKNPISNIIDNAATIIYATNRNAVLAKAREMARAYPGGGRWIEDVPMPEKAVHVETQKILDTFAKQGVNLDKEVAEQLARMQTFFMEDRSGDDRERIIVVKVKGEPRAVQINDPMLWKAFQAFEPVDLDVIGSILAVPADLLRAGVTLDPSFMARNFVRDTLSGYMQSQKGLVPFKDTVAGFKEVATRSDAAKLWRAFGGAHADLWKGDSTQTREILHRMAKRGKFDPRTILTPAGLLHVLQRLGSITESGTRVAEFKKVAGIGTKDFELDKVANNFDVDKLIDAAYASREVSVDFGMRGHSKAVRVLTRITPFLNPAMQGWYKSGRTGVDHFSRTAIRGSLLTAASLALFMLNRNQDWYDELEQWERNAYWHVDIGLREGGKVVPLRIPKPFEWGALFGSVPEALAKVAIDAQGVDFAKRLKSIFVDQFAVRAVPTAVLVPTELWGNRNTYTDRPIVSESKERLDPAQQYHAGTSLAAREAGKLTDSSPAKIDYAIRGFFGTLATYILAMTDQVVRAVGKYPDPPKSVWTQWPVVRSFVHDPNNPNTRYVTDFYRELAKSRQAEATLRRMEGEDAADYGEQHVKELERARPFNAAAKAISSSRKGNEVAERDRILNAEEKRQVINANNAKIRAIAKGVMVDRVQP